jgi:hypothetical protein
MKTDVQTLQDLFKIGYDAFYDSRMEAQEILNAYHNRQYTDYQLAVLANRGQPAETFNVIKLFGRLLLGYYSTVVNTVRADPQQQNDVLNASVVNSCIDYEMRSNQFETEGDKVKLDAILQGLMCVFIDVVDTGRRDQFGRKIKKLDITHVPADEIVLDPMSKKEDYSDGRFLHRFKWIDEENLINLIIKLGKTRGQAKKLVEELEAYYNHLNIDEAEFEKKYNIQFDGYFKRYDNYLIVNTVIRDDDAKWWSIYWSGDVELGRSEITFREVKYNYRVHKVNVSDRTEYYGIFREVIETQKAINQALLKIQLMVNTQKAFVENNGVEDIDKFTQQLNRVNQVIEVKSLKKIKIENLAREVIDQYTIIDKALDRIQRVLGVNDSFLGMAFASDSGRKVKLQQNATSLALTYLSGRIKQFYRLLGEDMSKLIKQYYTASQAISIADDFVGLKWIEVNKPMMQWTGQIDANGTPVMDYVYEEVLDPATGEPELDENGNIIVAPVPTQDTEIAFTDVDIVIDTVIYNDEDEKNQLMLETFISGPVGQMLTMVNPAGYLKAASLTVRSMKTKHSMQIAEILDETAMGLAQSGNIVPQMQQQGAPAKSGDLKLPQNTNEGA